MMMMMIMMMMMMMMIMAMMMMMMMIMVMMNVEMILNLCQPQCPHLRRHHHPDQNLHKLPSLSNSYSSFCLFLSLTFAFPRLEHFVPSVFPSSSLQVCLHVFLVHLNRPFRSAVLCKLPALRKLSLSRRLCTLCTHTKTLCTHTKTNTKTVYSRCDHINGKPLIMIHCHVV